MPIPDKIRALFDDKTQATLLNLRQDLHRHPELAFQEERTAVRLLDALKPLNPLTLKKIAGTGVLARIKGRNPNAPVVALRGDIDALPIQEATEQACASQTDGVMHACGHDVHAAWTVGAAHLLTAQPAAGDVLILLQPAEEIGKGALAVLESGVLQQVAAIFGAHVDSRFEVGEVVVQVGPLAASADIFAIELQGSGGHGARPHEACDPVVGAGALITALQTIVSRRLNPAHAGVVTIGMVQAGRAPNVIPDKASLTGTVRALEAQVRELLHHEIQTIASATAAAFNLTAKIAIELGTPPVINPEAATIWARRAAVALLGETAIKPLPTLNLAGEDFAFYLEKMPGCFLRIGARNAGDHYIPAHSPKFFAANESIFVGAAVLAETARIASEELSK